MFNAPCVPSSFPLSLVLVWGPGWTAAGPVVPSWGRGGSDRQEASITVIIFSFCTEFSYIYVNLIFMSIHLLLWSVFVACGFVCFYQYFTLFPASISIPVLLIWGLSKFLFLICIFWGILWMFIIYFFVSAVCF